jgi:hypothetical protein
MLEYHHCRCLESVVFGEIKANPTYFDKDLKDAYFWLEKEVGFYPIILAVGKTDEDIRMTGYQNQFGRILTESSKGNTYRKKGEFPNDVLFSFENVDGIFMDYMYWHIVLNSSYKNYQITDYEKRLIFKPSWNKTDWLRKAKKNPHSVQLVTSKLYLPYAKRIWVRNKDTKETLEEKGFNNNNNNYNNIEVKRLTIEEK